MIRTRSRVQKVPASEYVELTYIHGKPVVINRESNSEYTSCSSTISDVVAEGRFFHPVTHDSVITFLPKFSGRWASGSKQPSIGEYVATEFVGRQIDISSLNISPTMASSVVLSQLQADARRKAWPSLQPALNSYMLITDLLLLKGLFKSAITNGFMKIAKPVWLSRGDFFDKKREFLRECRNQGITGGRSFLKKLSRDASSDYLCYSFGWLPTIGDLSGLVDAVGRIATLDAEIEAQQWFVNHGRATYKKTRPFTASVTTSKLKLVGTEVTKATATTTIRWRWNNDHKRTFIEKVRAYATVLGLHQIFSAVWDLVPFSFVADWVLPFGNELDVLEASWSYQPRIDVEFVGSSLKQVNTITCAGKDITVSSVNGFALVPGSFICQPFVKKFTSYSRFIERDVSFNEWGAKCVSGINGKRASYLVAMVLQRGKSTH